MDCVVCGRQMGDCMCVRGDKAVEKRIYILENLGCANCAAKMEARIQALEGVQEASLTFSTRQLRVSAVNPDALLPQIREICVGLEEGVRVLERADAASEAHPQEKDGLLSLLAGVALFGVGIGLQRLLPVAAPLAYLAAYLLLGGQVLLKAARNLRKGQIFDENLLMCVATLGAFAIQDFAEGVGVMLFYRVGEYFEHRAVESSRKQIMAAVDMRPEVVQLWEEGEIRSIPAADARVGDLLLVRPGDRIPLDGVVVEGESRLDTSPITGEPVPVAVAVGSQVLSGCLNTVGLLKLRVEKPLGQSMVTRILDSVENAAAQKPKMDRFITRFARIYTPIVLAMAVLVAVIPSLVTGDWRHWVYTALTFLIISCPCALVLSVPLAFFSGIGAGSRNGILFKGGVTLEALAKVQVAVMDKTGTVTDGSFALRHIDPVPDVDEDVLLELAAACEQDSTHPIAGSIVSAAKERGVRPQRPHDLREIAGQGIAARLEEGETLCGSRELLQNHGVSLPPQSATDLATEVLIAQNGRYMGQLLISDAVKEDAVPALEAVGKMGIATAMLTGDNPQRAQEVARSVGIGEVHAGLLPQEKVDALIRIRERKGPVMFVGDGINDAPVLAAADVGAAIGGGADAAIEVADVVFMAAGLSALPRSFTIAKATRRVAIQNIVFALAVKAAMMVLGLAGFASMWMAVFADTGVALLCVLNSVRILYMGRSLGK